MGGFGGVGVVADRGRCLAFCSGGEDGGGALLEGARRELRLVFWPWWHLARSAWGMRDTAERCHELVRAVSRVRERCMGDTAERCHERLMFWMAGLTSEAGLDMQHRTRSGRRPLPIACASTSMQHLIQTLRDLDALGPSEKCVCISGSALFITLTTSAADCVVRPSWPDRIRAGSPDYARFVSDWPGL